jgi:hypothetical protein
LAVALQKMVIDPQFGFEVAALQLRIAGAASFLWRCLLPSR